MDLGFPREPICFSMCISCLWSPLASETPTQANTDNQAQCSRLLGLGKSQGMGEQKEAQPLGGNVLWWMAHTRACLNISAPSQFTVAESEWAFSKLAIIKNYMWTTMLAWRVLKQFGITFNRTRNGTQNWLYWHYKRLCCCESNKTLIILYVLCVIWVSILLFIKNWQTHLIKE